MVLVRDAQSVGESGLIGDVAVLTGGDRDVWADARARLMRDRQAAASIEVCF